MLDAASRFNQASSIGPLRRAFTFGSWTTMNSQGWVLLPDAAFVAASRILVSTSLGIESCLNSRMERRVLIPLRRVISDDMALIGPSPKVKDGEAATSRVASFG